MTNADLEAPATTTTNSTGDSKLSSVALITIGIVTGAFLLAGVGFGVGYCVGDRKHTTTQVVLGSRQFVGAMEVDGDAGEHLHGDAVQHELERIRAFATPSTPIDVLHEFHDDISFTLGVKTDGARRRLNAPFGAALTAHEVQGTVSLQTASEYLTSAGITNFTVDKDTGAVKINGNAATARPADGSQSVIVKVESTGEEILYSCLGKDCVAQGMIQKTIGGHGRKMVAQVAPLGMTAVGAGGTAGMAAGTVVAVGGAIALTAVCAIIVIGFINWGRNCLPADALVTAMLSMNAPPAIMPIAQVPHGAMVLSTAGFSPIYLYSHYTEAALTPMARIETRSGYAVELSAGHYIRACGMQHGAECVFSAAQNVMKGMSVELLANNGSIVHSLVTATRVVEKRGLFNPHTVAGDIVVASKHPANEAQAESARVSGIVVSDTSEWFAEGYVPEALIPSLYHAVLAPVRQLFALNPAWLHRFHERTVTLLEEEADRQKMNTSAADIYRRVVAGSLDALGSVELAKSAALTGFAGLSGMIGF